MRDKKARRTGEPTNEHFPPELLEPWQARVANVLGDPWRAHMYPLVGDQAPFWRLRRDDRIGTVSIATTLSGESQDDLIDLAHDFHPPS